ncbi:nucleotidyltransferase domain-containing protein [bacterium]|nr:nucleotidyltransferase domain-containing protein [bacterium]MBU1152534.1 nucleotidyltransferase domain-containing protein [bacterium]
MAQETDSEMIRETIIRYLNLLEENNISFEDVYLYGSYAKGIPKEDSDIDLAIIAEEWQPDIFDAQFKLMKLGRKIDTRIEPHPFIKSDFEKMNPYVQEILTTGKKIRYYKRYTK